MAPILGRRPARRAWPFLHNGLHGGPDPAARRRLELSLSRLPCPAGPARPGRRSDRGDPRRRLDDEAPARAVSGAARRLRLRRQGQDLSRRLVPRVQGDANGDARRPGAADRADRRSRQAARLAGAHGPRHRGRRRDRHDLVHGRQGRLPGRDLDRRQGPGAAGQRERRPDQHDEQRAPRRRRRRRQVRRPARAHRRLPRADRRLGRQHPGSREGRPEDGGEVACRARLARRRDGGGRRDEGRRRREPEEGARLAAAGAAPGHGRDRLRPVGPRHGLARVRRARAAADRRRRDARVLRPLRLRRDAEGARGVGRARAGGAGQRCSRAGDRSARRGRPGARRIDRQELRDGDDARGARRLDRPHRSGRADRARPRDRFARSDPRPPDRPVALGRCRRGVLRPARPQLRRRARPAAARRA